MDILYIVIPAYNEESNIRKIIEEWYPVVEKHNGGGASRLVVLDDGSKDTTFSILEDLARSHPLLCPVTKTNEGHGATIHRGYRYALQMGADYIFQTDSDGQTRPEEFEPFWAEREKWDMLIGWRKAREDGFGRVFTTRVLRLVIASCFHVRIQDANTPYRLMKADPLAQAIGFIPADFFLTNVMISVYFTKKGFSVKYIPITFRPRQGGKNSINMKRIIRIGLQAVRDFRRLNRSLQ